MATSLINTECKRYGCRKNLLACYANCRYNTRCDELRNEVEANIEQVTTDINAYRKERGLNLIQLQLPKRGLKFVEVKSLSSPPKKQSVVAKLEVSKLKKTVQSQSPRQTNANKIESQPLAKRRKKKRRAKVRITKPLVSPVQKVSLVEAMPEPQLKRLQKKKSRKVRKTKSIAENRIKMPRKSKAMAVEAATESNNRLITPSSETGHIIQPAEVKVASPGRSSRKATTTKKPKKLYIVLEGVQGTLVDESGLMKKLLAGVAPGARFFEASEMEVRLQLVKK